MFGCLARKICIDLGTTSTLVYLQGKGLVIQEDSLVALEKNKRTAVAVGEKARLMLGKTPKNIIFVRPLIDGVINNFDMAGLLLMQLISRLNIGSAFIRPEITISTPKGITKLEKKAFSEIALLLGGSRAKIIEEPFAAAIGAGLPVDKPFGNMVVDIGGGITEAVVISLSEIVISKSSRLGGDRFDEAIINYLKRNYNFKIGENTAEIIKKKLVLPG